MEKKEEIGLVYLIKVIYRFWIRRKILVAFLFILPLGLMFIFHLNSVVLYSSQTSLNSKTIAFNLINQIYSPLFNSIKAKNTNSTARLFDISVEDAVKINSSVINEVKNPTLQSFGCSFSIELTVSDSSVIKKLEQPLERYFLNNKYVKKLQITKQEKLENNLNKIDEQINRLNSIQTLLPNALNNQAENSVISDLGLGEIYTQMTSLYVLKHTTIAELNLINEISVVSGFEYTKRIGGLFKKLAFGLIIGLFFITGAILYRGLMKVLKE